MSDAQKQTASAGSMERLVSLRWWTRGWYRLGIKIMIQGPWIRVERVIDREDMARRRLERAKQANA